MIRRALPCIILLAAVLVACSGGHVQQLNGSFMEGNARPVMDTSADQQGAGSTNDGLRIMSSGAFVAGSHSGSGTAAYIANGTSTSLLLRRFQSQRGLGMRVYLASDASGTRHVDLGPVQGYNGDYWYALPQGTSTSSYPYVLIWSTDSGNAFLVAKLD